MAQALLVNVDIGAGAELLDILDRAKVKVRVALWAHLAEYADWRMILAGRQFDALPTTMKAYRLLHNALRAGGFPFEKEPPMMILPMTSPFIKDLRRAYAKSKNVEGLRPGGQLFGDRFVEDGYVYRIS
jgi:hypothetical protein